MIILGLNAYHGDSAACILRNGIVVAAAEEERFRRIKHWAGFPSAAIRFCLAEGRLDLADVDVVAVNSDPRASFLRKAGYVLRNRPQLGLLLDRLSNQARRQTIRRELAAAFRGQRFQGKIERVEHHLAHLASAYLVSPFAEASIASIDGFGDFASAAWGRGEGNRITIEDRVHFPHSLGVFYQALTQFLGFPNYGDEYKVMGLAPYGEPEFVDMLRKVVRLCERGRFELDTRYFRHHRKKIDYAWEGGAPHVGILYSDVLTRLLGPARAAHEPLSQRHRNIARSVQAVFEEAFFHLLAHLHGEHGADNLTLAGGCAMNSVANGKVVRNTPFKRLYVQPAAGDAGGAIGAAMYVWHKAVGRSRHDRPVAAGIPAASAAPPSGRFVMDHAYLGPAATEDEIAGLLASQCGVIEAANCVTKRIDGEAELYRHTAEAIADGQVVGWFQGRMEWGPRALGNRSILGDPRRADMKDILNAKIKRRESFRPFAPSVLREHVGNWFEEEGDVPFMMQVYQIRGEKRASIPAVTHVDGSGRLQTVHRNTNPQFWALIEAFRELTGVPMVLNTSFNENEPVVCRPHEALDCFLRTRMDLLVIGNWMVQREAVLAAQPGR